MWKKEDLSACFGINQQANSVAIDSRQAKPDSIFIGIKGQNYDGSMFAKKALQQGAKLCITHFIPEDCNTEADKFLVVPDTYNDGLMKLANYNRNIKHKDTTFIGVTGSVGKTTTKQMLKLVFVKTVGNSFASYGNKNNKYGLPFSLANINKFPLNCGIFEMGMSAKGQISYLSKILKPNIAVITGIAPAHLQSFSSVDDIARAKAQILEYTTNFFVVNCDSSSIGILIQQAQKYNLKTIGYSRNQINIELWGKIIVKNIQVEGKDFQAFTNVTSQYEINGGNKTQINYRIKGIGDDLVMNSCAVLGCLIAYGADPNGIKFLSQYETVSGRGTLIDLPRLKIKLIDETYNSNPTSLTSALNKLHHISVHMKCNRKIAVLGDMFALGPKQIQYHQAILDQIISNKIDTVFCVGKRMKYLFNKFEKNVQGLWCETSQQMAQNIIKFVQQEDVLMIKGSNGMKMKNICQKILNHQKQFL